jgi:hypothetical protein
VDGWSVGRRGVILDDILNPAVNAPVMLLWWIAMRDLRDRILPIFNGLLVCVPLVLGFAMQVNPSQSKLQSQRLSISADECCRVLPRYCTVVNGSCDVFPSPAQWLHVRCLAFRCKGRSHVSSKLFLRAGMALFPNQPISGGGDLEITFVLLIVSYPASCDEGATMGARTNECVGLCDECRRRRREGLLWPGRAGHRTGDGGGGGVGVGDAVLRGM